jgi:uncharacterized protein (DUF1697 family)
MAEAKAVLLRGVNVGGAGKLPMAEFRALLESLGLGQVRSYIQSGNAVFDSDLATATLESLIRDAIFTRFGFAPDTFVLTAPEIATALTDHPFADADPARVHVFFLREMPAPDEAALQALALPGDGWQVGPRRLTLHTPDGIGRSKLAEKLPKYLPSPMTARNLRTIAALHAMLTDLAHP